MEESELILSLLPDGYKYKILKYTQIDQSSPELKFDLDVRVNVSNELEVKKFLQEVYTSTGCTFNVKNGRADKVPVSEKARCGFRGYRKCSMNVFSSEDRKSLQPGKNTDCEASITFRVENPVCKNKDTLSDRQQFPLWVNINYNHNHSLNRADFLKYQTVSPDTKAAYTELFHQGVSPSAAHTEIKCRIKEEYPDTWPNKFADRSILPSVFWVYYWNRVHMDYMVGSRDGVDAFNKAEEMVKQFNDDCHTNFPTNDRGNYAAIGQSDKGQTVVVICDPFQQRVHATIPQSGELIFVDATSGIDRNDTKLFHLICPSVIGGLPVASILSTREDEETIVFALNLLKTVLPIGAFFGRGKEIGPQLFMTDDCDALKNALTNVWSRAELLLCSFHVLQAQWNWLWNSDHSISKADRPILLNLFRSVLYAESESELSDSLEQMYASPVCLRYPQYQAHLMRDTFPKIKAWSMLHRITNLLPTSGNNTNNYVECSFRYTKEDQMNRHKAYNLPDLLTILLDNSEFYVNKCVDTANNVLESWLRNCHSKYVLKKSNIDPDQIVQIGPHSYLVPSESHSDVSYLVDMKVRHCSCPQGQLRGPCKHKQIVSVSKNVQSFDVIPSKNPLMRKQFMFLGTGRQMPLDWFLPMQEDLVISEDVQIADQVVDFNQGSQDENDENLNCVNIELEPEKVKVKLDDIFNQLKFKIEARISHDPLGYDKALGTLQKTVQRLPSTSDSALQKCLHAFGKTVTQVKLLF